MRSHTSLEPQQLIHLWRTAICLYFSISALNKPPETVQSFCTFSNFFIETRLAKWRTIQTQSYFVNLWIEVYFQVIYFAIYRDKQQIFKWNVTLFPMRIIPNPIFIQQMDCINIEHEQKITRYAVHQNNKW